MFGSCLQFSILMPYQAGQGFSSRRLAACNNEIWTVTPEKGDKEFDACKWPRHVITTRPSWPLILEVYRNRKSSFYLALRRGKTNKNLYITTKYCKSSQKVPKKLSPTQTANSSLLQRSYRGKPKRKIKWEANRIGKAIVGHSLQNLRLHPPMPPPQKVRPYQIINGLLTATYLLVTP